MPKSPSRVPELVPCGLEEQHPALLPGLAPSSLGKAQGESRGWWGAQAGGPWEGPSFSLPITSSEVEPRWDLRDTEPMQEPRG